MDLIKQSTANRATANEPDRERLCGEIKPGMYGAQRARNIVRIDHRRNIALGGALGDSADIDAGTTQITEEPGGDTRRACHTVAHHGDDALCVRYLHPLNLAARDFFRKRRRNDFLCMLCHFGRHRDANRMLGTCLRNQRDGYTGVLERRKQPVCRAGHADHAGTFEVD